MGTTYRAIRTWSELPVGSPASAAETMVLEFKAEHEHDVGEHAKDVAAFANAFGGVILVGVSESADSFTRKLLTVGEAKRVARNYEDAARDLLAPRPLIDVCILLEPPAEANAIVAVNVDPFPGQLVGARLPQSEAWRFPVRTATRHCAYLDPEKAMIYSEPRARKAAILLTRIPESARANMYVQVAEQDERRGYTAVKREISFSGALQSIDVEANAVTFLVLLRDNSARHKISVPLEDVGAVWSSGQWQVKLTGRIRLYLNEQGYPVCVYICGM